MCKPLSSICSPSVLAGAFLLLFSATEYVEAQRPAIDFSGLDPALAVAPTEILVLASPHLSNFQDAYQPVELDEMRRKLVAYRPAVITIESLAGEMCETLAAYPNEYPGVADQYCRDMSEIRVESSLDMRSALAEIRNTLGVWPRDPTPAQRRRLAAAFLAANDRYSALVQWLQLPLDGRIAGDGLGEKSLELLRKLDVSMNENSQLGAHVAAQLGLQRVYACDDHTADLVFASTPDSAWTRMQELWKRDPVNMKAEMARLDSLMDGPSAFLTIYRAYNTPRLQRMAADSDFRIAMNDSVGLQVGRRYLAWWQTRNLRMAASIVAAAAEAPGGKVLSIVGASHKPYFDGYLDQMHDVRLGNVEQVLR